mgnify:CR=1 FL=1
MPRKKTATVSVNSDTVKDLEPAEPAKKRAPTRSRKPPEPAKPVLGVYTPSGSLDLKFNNDRELEHAFQQITFKCASGRAATVVSEGKEYTFCSVNYVVRDEPEQE